jgi:hypothetical protein
MQELLNIIEGNTDGKYWDKIVSRNSTQRQGVGLKRKCLFSQNNSSKYVYTKISFMRKLSKHFENLRENHQNVIKIFSQNWSLSFTMLPKKLPFYNKLVRGKPWHETSVSTDLFYRRRKYHQRRRRFCFIFMYIYLTVILFMYPPPPHPQIFSSFGHKIENNFTFLAQGHTNH